MSSWRLLVIMIPSIFLFACSASPRASLIEQANDASDGAALHAGLAQYHRGEFEVAREWFLRALAASIPTDTAEAKEHKALAHLWLGKTYRRMSRVDYAEREFKEALWILEELDAPDPKLSRAVMEEMAAVSSDREFPVRTGQLDDRTLT